MAKIAGVDPGTVCVKIGVCIPSDADTIGAAFPPLLPLIPRGRNILGVPGGRSRQLADIFGGIGPVVFEEEKKDQQQQQQQLANIFGGIGPVVFEEEKAVPKDDGKVSVVVVVIVVVLILIFFGGAFVFDLFFF